MTQRTAVVIGAGWAGCAAAIELARAGWRVTLLEAARTLGGRARRVEADGRRLDNGQHILLGAYTESLRLMKLAGVDTGQALLSLPLQMRYPPGSGGMDFIAPRLPAPLHLLAALLRSTGLSRDDKLSLARFSTTARWMGWRLDSDCSVTDLLARFDQTPRLVQLMWRPLCLAALNTPPERASAQIFLNVLRDSLGARRRASDMLIPRADLSALFPDAAARHVETHGGMVHAGAKATALTPLPGGRWRVAATGSALAEDWHADADAVILAPGAPAAAALLRGIAATGAAAIGAGPPPSAAVTSPASPAQQAPLSALAGRLDAFVPEPITTCYLQYGTDVRLDLPFYALLDDPAARHWGQFVFDRGQLDPAQAAPSEAAPSPVAHSQAAPVQAGLLAVVISASSAAIDAGQDALCTAVAAQLAAALRRPELAQPSWTRVITEKRATYACSPGLIRPTNATGVPGLLLAGDYTAGADAGQTYPATLESAVRSGVAAARSLLSNKPSRV